MTKFFSRQNLGSLTILFSVVAFLASVVLLAADALVHFQNVFVRQLVDHTWTTGAWIGLGFWIILVVSCIVSARGWPHAVLLGVVLIGLAHCHGGKHLRGGGECTSTRYTPC